MTCEVSEPSSASSYLRLADANDEGGRGLFMIAQLANAWDTRCIPTGKTIWAEQAMQPDPPRTALAPTTPSGAATRSPGPPPHTRLAVL
ncbi:ATP-binding protein [Kitasatospora acidiphila]|uniref:ATP-binding protein n=1 Tax=Kitasatospora acidiphila TaxID=2567942 RepID=A0A540VX34_9ACTN|nr:ATP-binding protein [Kitasatospora acidiphila]